VTGVLAWHSQRARLKLAGFLRCYDNKPQHDNNIMSFHNSLLLLHTRPPSNLVASDSPLLNILLHIIHHAFLWALTLCSRSNIAAQLSCDSVRLSNIVINAFLFPKLLFYDSRSTCRLVSLLVLSFKSTLVASW